MQIAVTGGTGFIGRYILEQLLSEGHRLRCWSRPDSDRSGLDDPGIQWVTGDLANPDSMDELTHECHALVHSALWRPGRQFRGGEGDVPRFAEMNIVGSLRLIQSARDAGVERFVYLSTCAVHEIILEDRPLDEAHPLWATSHYGAHKAAVEKFVHSYGLGEGFNICALRPTGVYGLAQPVEHSKWFDLVRGVVEGRDTQAQGGGKEVHAADVARAVSLLLAADNTAGQAFNCYDRYVSQYEVATLAREISGSGASIIGQPRSPKHEIGTDKIRRVGMTFGGAPLLRETIAQMVATIAK